MNILITRPLIDSEDLMGKLFSLGHKIVHIPTLKISAANVSHVGHYRDIYNANVLATEHLLSLALNCQHGVEFHHISTLSVLNTKEEKVLHAASAWVHLG